MLKSGWSPLVLLFRSLPVPLRILWGLLQVHRLRLVSTYYYYLLVFRTRVSRWFLTWVWKTASLLKSQGLFSVFWPISIIFQFLMVSTRPLISKSSSPGTNSLVTYQEHNYNSYLRRPHVPHFFFQFSSKTHVFILLFAFFSRLHISQPGQQNPQFGKSFLLLLIINWSGRLAEITWSVCMSKSQRSLSVSFSWTDFWLSMYHFSVW